MSIRIAFKPVLLSPTMELFRYWGAMGYSRPTTEVYLIAPSGHYRCVPRALFDNGSDFAIFDPDEGRALGLSPPFHRQVQMTTASGPLALTMPDDGTVALFITDYREYYYLPASPIGFWTGSVQRNILGVTGFLQYFSRHTHNDGVNYPELELTANQSFPGRHGSMVGQALAPLMRQLRGTP